MQQKRISKAEWLEKALEVLEAEGVNGVKIDRLAKLLGISRSGFYWHFKGRAELLEDMLEYWKHEYTEVVTDGSWALSGQLPGERIMEMMRMVVEYRLDRYEVPIRAWAAHDPVAAAVVQDVYNLRFKFIESLFAEMGFEGVDLEIRVRLWLCFGTNAKLMFAKASREETDQMLEQCYKVLVSKTT